MLDPDELYQQSIEEVLAVVSSLAVSLPSKLSAASLGVKEKAPFQLLSIREPLMWRTEELARCACRALQEGDLAVAASLTRSIAESVAVAWRLAEIIEQPFIPDKVNESLMNIFGASRTMKDRGYKYQILNFVDLVDKSAPGTRSMYDDLSEIAHPNWQGMAGLYSKLDQENHEVIFGKEEQFYKQRKTQTAILLSTFLQLFVLKYDQISDRLPAWIAGMTPIWPS